MSDQTFEASSVEGALEKAASALGVDVADLDHEVVEKRQDFWGTGDTYVVRAWQAGGEDAVAAEEAAPEAEEAAAHAEDQASVAEEEESDDEKPADEAADEQEADDRETDIEAARAAEEAGEDSREGVASEPRDADDGVAPTAQEDEVEPPAGGAADAPKSTDSAVAPAFDPAAEGPVEPAQVVALLAQIFHDMEFDCTVEAEPDDEGFSATISGPDKEALLEGNGRCLSALELLVNNAFRNRMSRGDKIRVDAGDFRSRRDQELTDLAYQVAHSAKESGKIQETPELNPYERRLVHLALAEDQGVTTKSRGSGFLKNVQVIPQNQGRGRRGGGRRR